VPGKSPTPHIFISNLFFPFNDFFPCNIQFLSLGESSAVLGAAVWIFPAENNSNLNI
jgi:hypothetical protein